VISSKTIVAEQYSLATCDMPPHVLPRAPEDLLPYNLSMPLSTSHLRLLFLQGSFAFLIPFSTVLTTTPYINFHSDQVAAILQLQSCLEQVKRSK
jgi:hypothetical protein